jgi:tetratricopeptide (TPR) repeat protein
VKRPDDEPDGPRALFRRGVELDGLGRRDEAVAAWRRVVALKPSHAAAWYNLGVVAKVQARWQDALELFDRAHAEDPEDVDTLHCRGHVRQELGEEELARADLEAAIEVYDVRLDADPEDAEQLFWRGAARARLGERDGALADLAAAIAADPQRREQAREEIDFRPLADDPEFIRLTIRTGRREG